MAVTALAACSGGGNGGGGAGGSTPLPAQSGALQLDSATYSIQESSGIVTIAVTRTGGSDGAVTASIATADGTAMAGQDFGSVAAIVSFAAGDSAAKTFDIAITDDALTEPAENFSVALSAPTGGATLGAPATAVVTIEDGDDTIGPLPSAGSGLNDTGVTGCSNGVNNALACNDAPAGTDQYPGQDAEHGRDATSNDDSDGRAGFSFIKLDSGGAPLADQSTTYGSSPWDCVLDNVTGLTWEVKTDDDGLRDRSWTYSWYNTSGSNDDGHEGVASGGACADATTCDTQQYTAAVNGAVLCGRDDWRLPTRTELLSLVDYGVTTAPLIGLDHFPNLGARAYWSASNAGGDAWGFAGGTAWGVDFDDGKPRLAPKHSARAVRLVSGGVSQ